MLDTMAVRSFEADLAECLEQDGMIAEALAQQVSLRDYSEEVEAELALVEAESVRDYLEQAPTVAVLHGQMVKCDAGLLRIQKTLGKFGDELGGLAREVRKVQETSEQLKIKTANRYEAEAGLAAYLRRLVLPSDAETVIESADVFDAKFAAYASLVDCRLDELGREPRDTRRYAKLGDTVAGAESREVLEKLRGIIVQRARDALLAAIGDLKNLAQESKCQRVSSILKREQLVSCGALVQFLEKRGTVAAIEVRQAYGEATGKALHWLLKSYNDELAKHDLVLANKHDLVAVDEAAVRSGLTSRVSLAKRGDAFAVGDRHRVLKEFDDPPLRASQVKRDKLKLPCESLLRSSLKRFRDTTKAEHAVCRAVFGDEADEVFEDVLRRAAPAFLEHLEARLSGATRKDVVGLSLIGKLVDMSKGELAALDRFYEACDEVVWPRLEYVVALNIDSAKRASATKLGGTGVSPHYVARRFAELASTILTLFPRDDDAPEIIIKRSVTETLRDEVLSLLARIATETFENEEPTTRVVFLLNNYDHIITVLDERLPDRDLALRKYIEQILDRQRDAYLDATIDAGLGAMVAFVRKTESDMAKIDKGRALLEIDAQHCEKLVHDFAAKWESFLAKVNTDVLTSFSNFRNGTELFKRICTQFLVYYTKFQDIVRTAWRRPPPFAKDLVSTGAIMIEIKKYTRSLV